MKKKIIISCLAVVILGAILAVGFGVGANYTNTHPRREAYGENWVQKTDAAPTKTIRAENSAKLDKEAVLSGKKQASVTLSATVEPQTEELTYAVTNTMEEDNPLDVYRDSDLNEYRYNQDGELDTYRQSFSTRKNLEQGEEPCTEEESLKLAWAYLQKLFGSRMDGYKFDFVDASESGNFWVVYYKKFGVDDFIRGAAATATIRETGELGGATISDDPMEDFNPACVEGLTRQMVADKVIPEVQARLGDDTGKLTVDLVYLERFEDGFRLRVGVDVERGGYETAYYNLY